LEDKPHVLSESSLLSPDSKSSFCEFDQLTPKQRAEVDAEFEKSSSNCSTAIETKHPRGDEAASLEISRHENGQEARLQKVGEFDTFSDHAAESNVQLCDKLSAGVNTSRSKTDPADEISPKATENRVNVDSDSSQLAACFSSDLCHNLLRVIAPKLID